MKTLFGLPITSLMTNLLVIVSIFLLIILLLAARNPVIARIAVRNIFRRWTQSMLMIAGLTLSTIMITSAIGIGDTLAYSTRYEAVQRLGQIDIEISTPSGSGTALLSQADYDALRPQAEAVPNVRGVAPRLTREVSLIAPESGQGAPIAMVYAIDQRYEDVFGSFTTSAGEAQPLGALAADEIYLNGVGAAALQAKAGDTVELYHSDQPTTARVRAIIRNNGLPANQPVAVMPLARAQAMYSLPQHISAMAIATSSDVEADATISDAVTTQLRLLVSSPESAARVKALLGSPAAQDALTSGIAALASEPTVRERLLAQARSLQAELSAPAMSDTLRSLLADNELSTWVEQLTLPEAEQRELAAEMSTLSRLQVSDSKARALAKAEFDGSQFLQIFLIMGTFSILVGMLLVFLLFVMLAAERRSEMGMARAVGLQRAHLIQMFITEGMIYELVAGLIGVVLGIGLSRVMVGALALAFLQVQDTGFGREIIFHITPAAVVVSLCLGLMLTTVTVAFSAWRISRMNIVAAIRDTPEEEGRTGWLPRLVALLRAGLVIFAGLGSVAGGYAGTSLPLVYFGLSVTIIGVSLLLVWLLRLTPLRRSSIDRLVYTIAGSVMLTLWLLPGMDRVLGIENFTQGAAIFITSGIFLIVGAIWVVMYNLDLLLTAINLGMGRFGRLAPILRTAVAYPLVSKFRTGLAIAMFSLIIFTIVMVSAITSTEDAIYANHDTFTGDYQIVAVVSGENRIGDLKTAIQQTPGIDAAALGTVTSVGRQLVETQQVGQTKRVVSALYAPDRSYYEHVAGKMRLKMRGAAFASEQAVWDAMRTRDDVALLTRLNVRSGTSPNAEPGGAFVLAGTAYIEDATLPPTSIELRVPGTQQSRTVEVIGVIDSYGVPMTGLFTNAATVEALNGAGLPAALYMINTREGTDTTALAQQIEKAFLTDGLDVGSIDKLVADLQAGDKVVFTLLKGFLALGLLVGVAALGVISSRNVIERRQQIGMLRAIGFHSGMVQLSFMVEASVIALLGMALGTILGLVLGANVTAEIARSQPGVQFNPEWGTLGMILLATYGFSLLTTYLPARRAARIYPAEALRYE